MKLIKFHAKIKQNNEHLVISHQNNENHKIPRNPRQNHENNENEIIPCQNF